MLRSSLESALSRFVLSFVLIAMPSSNLFAITDDAGKLDFFENKIRPVLVQHCYECHSTASGESQSELLLDNAEAMRQGGARGPAVVPGQSDASLLIRALEYGDRELQMPPAGKLPEEVIADFRKWIADGGIDPREGKAPTKKLAPDEQAAKAHWAFQIPVSLPVGKSASSTAASGTVDSIDLRIRERLSTAGLSPSPEASKLVLVRRLYADLLGLPPSIEEVNAFVADNSPNAYERLVQRLLASPTFGERWARHWMDVARYADTKGYVFQEDRNYPGAFRYREWLIRAFNEDLPYDRFITLQLAADKIDPKNERGDLDAMGFLTLGRRFLNNINDIIDDRIDVVCRGVMGLTVGCARCHDHKFDPIKSADYYSLYGVFNNSHEPGGEPSPLRMEDTADQRGAYVFLRGQPWNRGPDVDRRFLKFLSSSDAAAFGPGSGRLDLAAAITSPQNPLTARVFVNRVWLRLVGSNLIDTPSDLGVRSPAPTHLDVLDDLSVQFMQSGWSTKELIRRIVSSATYRQSSIANNEAAIATDPENRLLWRMNRKRADFELLRDSILASTGELDRRIGGPSAAIDAPPYSPRRSVYAFVDRQNLPGIFRVFDVASPDAHNPQRSQTTVPQQGLFLLNSPWIADLSERLASRFEGQALSQKSFEQQAQIVLETVWARPCSDREREAAVEFLRQAVSERVEQPANQWKYGYATFNRHTQEIGTFEEFPTFSGGMYRGRMDLPDAQLGWASLNAMGGHPGEPGRFAAVRRWIAPRRGMVRIAGTLQHHSEAGDGVNASVIVTGKPQAVWLAHNQALTTEMGAIAVTAGDTIDFVVDAGESVNNDSFTWNVKVRYRGSEGPKYESAADFSGPNNATYSALAQLVQALLASNELAFVD